jgi:hypothetical protein
MSLDRGAKARAASVSVFQFPHPLLKTLERGGQRFVAELVGVIEARQRGALVLSAGDLETESPCQLPRFDPGS